MNAVMRTDEHHITKHASILGIQNKCAVQVLFFGDSITRRWEDNIELWNEYFAEFHPANLGVGADTLENMLWRVQNGELDGFSPRVIIFLGGTNNVTSDTAEDIAQKIRFLAAVVKEKCPSSHLVVTGLLPRSQDDSGKDCREKIQHVNDILKNASAADGYTFEYYGDELLADDGSIDFTIMSDGLHLNAEGYKKAGPILRKIIQKSK